MYDIVGRYRAAPLVDCSQPKGPLQLESGLNSELQTPNSELGAAEEAHLKEYRAISEALGNRSLIIRTLDLGGDKLPSYFPQIPEGNPSLGIRGVRLALQRPAFLTGVTEPVEFTFMFLAPVLYLIHAVLTGVSMALMDLLHVKLGFTFSAGAFDYIISYKLATNGWLLIPVGLVYFLVYYFLFSIAIRKLNLATPGRAEAAAEKALYDMMIGFPG
jgi:PEP-utilizing family enzyme